MKVHHTLHYIIKTTDSQEVMDSCDLMGMHMSRKKRDYNMHGPPQAQDKSKVHYVSRYMIKCVVF